MVNDEGPGDIFVNALKFSVSNITSLAIWGIALVVAIITAMIIMLTAVFLFYDNTLVLIVLMLLAYLPVIAVGVLMMGFISQCMKTVIDGGSVMPMGLESPARLAKDGIMTMIIALEAFVAEMICFAPAFLVIFLVRYDDGMMLIAMALMLLAMPVIIVIFFLNMIQWAVYADTGSLLRGLNPIRPFSLIRSNLRGAVIMLLLLIAAYVLFSVLMFALELLIITILLLPFLAVAMYVAIAYIVAVFYRQSRGDRFDVRDAATTGYSVS
jgi:hypothetical protein